MQWYKYFYEVKDEMFHFNEAKPTWMEHLIFHRMGISVPLQEWENIHYLFDITWEIQIFKQI